MSAPFSGPLRVIGRYALYGEIAAGGMATVHFGRLLGPAGFARTVAIKRLHAQYAKDPEFVSMFLDEARLAARIRHPNVVPTLDVVAAEGELFLVMEYVSGESLAKLIRGAKSRGERIPPRIVVSVVSSVLHGLHAAHEAKNEQGVPLGLVHRDVSPQNVLVGTDGVSRVLDFGVAKAAGRVQTTREGQLKGKLAYMAPEQIKGGVSRRTDVYAAAVVLWEALTSQRLFVGENEAELLHAVLHKEIDPPSHYAQDALPPAIDEVVLKGLEREQEKRWATAREMAVALERALPMASPSEIGEWVEANAGNALQDRADKIAVIESSSSARFDRPELPAELTSSPSGVSAVSGVTSAPSIPSAISPAPISRSDSQLSSVSVERGAMSPSAPPVQKKPRTVVAIVVAALALVAGIVLFVTLREPHGASGDDTTSSKPPALGVPSISPSVAPTPTASETIAASAAPSASTAPSIAATTPPTIVTKPTTTPTWKPPVTKPTAKPATNCDPPYSIDAKGKKIYKPECI